MSREKQSVKKDGVYNAENRCSPASPSASVSLGATETPDGQVAENGPRGVLLDELMNRLREDWGKN